MGQRPSKMVQLFFAEAINRSYPHTRAAMQDRNANRPGYKKTKAGWIPKEWECVPAGSLFDIQLGKMLNKKARNGNNQQPYLANYNVRWGEFDLSEVQQMSFYEKELYKFELQQGDLLVCEGGEVGRCAVWEEQIKPCYYQKALHRVRPSGENTDVYFVMYFLNHVATSPMMVHYVSQTSISHFTREQFLNFPIALPSLPEQKKIVKILFAWDTAIDKTRKLITAKTKRKKALMQQLLDGSATFYWKEITLKKAFKRIQRKTTDDIDAILSITANVGFVHQNDKFSRVIAGKNLNRYILLKEGEFAYNKGNSKSYPQGCVYMLQEYEQGAVPNVYLCFKPRTDEILGQFYKYYFEAGLLNHQLYRVINTGVRNDGLLNLNPRDFFNLHIMVPPVNEQRRIADIFTNIDFEISSLKNELAAMEKQKRGLMQKLLTGEVRVKT
jgi:type I restriction enzyme S subunit